MREWRRHTVVLSLGFALSIGATSGWLGQYHGWAGQPTAVRWLVLFLMPLTATTICAVIRSLQRRPLAAEGSASADAAVRGIVFWVITFLIAVHTLLLGFLLGAVWIAPWAARAVVVLFGLTILLTGNLLPRTRPNLAVGIRTSRTLTDPELWALTHRVTGYTAVALGAVTMFAGLFLGGRDVAALPGSAFMAAMLGLVAFYWKVTRGPRRASRA
ncbi:MAG TPA: SdpI family protein [Vicinamibacterales bacterium]|nr:SdpI family protein [Vicinamibacterales bacterium]